MLTGEIIDWFEMKILNGEKLSQWAEQLLMEGRDTPEICMAAASPDAHWEDVHRWFVTICRQLGISDQIDREAMQVKERVMIDEYRKGLRKGADLLKRFNGLQKRIGFPEIVIYRLMPDARDGTNASGYYSLDSGLTGEQLEQAIRPYFEKAGIYAA
jgi:hypothetical protein